LIRCWND